MKYFVANWKANKNLEEAFVWVDGFLKNNLQLIKNQVIICPPYPLIYPLKEKLSGLKNIFLGSQDISAKSVGSFTGEVTGYTLKNLVSYVIIGHSERRTHFSENNEILKQKLSQAVDNGLKPIYCLRGSEDFVPDNVEFIAYEPISAIGTGKNETVDNVLMVREKLNLKPGTKFLYGGSVNKNNAGDYLRSDKIDGFIIGGVSLDPQHFFEITQKG